jgi:hypothetical protein
MLSDFRVDKRYDTEFAFECSGRVRGTGVYDAASEWVRPCMPVVCENDMSILLRNGCVAEVRGEAKGWCRVFFLFLKRTIRDGD